MLWPDSLPAAKIAQPGIRVAMAALASVRLRGRPWYQCVDVAGDLSTEPLCAGTPGQARHRTETFARFLRDSGELRASDVVVDVGSNAGLYTLMASRVARRAIGVEFDDRFHRQALLIRSLWQASGRDASRARLIYGDITRKLGLFRDADVVFASKVLYHEHLGDGVHDIMRAIEAGPARTIMIQGHSVQGELGTDDGIRDLTAKYGFTYTTVLDDHDYPIAIARREGSS